MPSPLGRQTPTGLNRRPLVRCRCRCHCHIGADNDTWTHGVDVRDPVAAALACSTCQNAHAPALLETTLPNDPERRRLSPVTECGEFRPPQADGWKPEPPDATTSNEDGD